MSKYVFIKTANDDAYMNTAANFRGAVHSADTAVDLYFNAAGSGVAGAFDKIPLVVTTQKEQEVMDAIGGALAGSHSKGMVVIADDVASSYVNGNISSVGAVSLASTGALMKKNVESVTADDTLTADESGKMFIFADVDGATLTLPDSGGGDIIGTYFDFFVGISATSNEHKVVNADTTNEKMWGNLMRVDTDTSDTLVAEPCLVGDNFSAIAFDGTTTGILGSFFRLTNTAADRWFVEGTILVNGTAATSLGTT